MSRHNPFRTPGVTPQPTGASTFTFTSPSTSAPPPASPHPNPNPPYAPPPGPPPSSTAEAHDDLPEIPEDLPALPDEPPPAYSSAPDPWRGEATIELGPRRPFQQPPAPAPAPAPPAPPGPPQSQPPPGASSYPGSVYRQHTGAPPPPPQHPHTRRRSAAGGSAHTPTPAPLSDFARDFYAAGADGGGDAGTGAAAQPSQGAYQPRYAPPPGPPPRSPGGGVPDDGRPTRTPVPGHPLLRDGRLLVYPGGYECHKCASRPRSTYAMVPSISTPAGRNTGYRNFDPSHPCGKCWDRYAKPFAGAVAYADWASPASASSGKTFQRPLPSFSPPHLSSPNSSSSHLRPPATAPPRPHSYAGYESPSPGFTTAYAQAPPAGAAVVQPGDPRIGGNLCWQCGGSGRVPVFLLMEERCGVCGGLGRVFA
ncbi:hypothetical protein GLOTRDRAFT_128042 [Gloeophyllum trabeum ATCC 11539]|uniref:Uncharacterized protein n=1 Tax=Gloeophyllum trabeum (strain ATCC 11539 / FP-39264 / Madison 617) TaxID=670483 RepID=S7RSR1_GLOTA|nr:uncharacterized protein GLOTRDRAFT_128042 [Gloeophyllum trabeum ATCC 11539]EPQ56084.1 hypothetical protein GLOTRDRAFT_128042 [Gloeophyllum trabeum ATCC 11539]